MGGRELTVGVAAALIDMGIAQHVAGAWAAASVALSDMDVALFFPADR